MRAIIADVTLLLTMLVEAALGVVWVVLMVPLWRLSGRSPSLRLVCYAFLLFWELSWLSVLGQLFEVVSVPLAWQIGLEGLVLALIVATLVLLLRHRHEPDVEAP